MKYIFSLCFLLLLSGCATHQSRMSLIVPNGTNFTISDLDNAKVKKDITGSDTAPILLFFTLGQPNFETAVKKTLANGQGEVLVDAEITEMNRWFILFGYNKIEITGNVLQLPTANERLQW